MSFRFIHAADIHLDSPMQGLSKYEGAPEHRLREATREALSQLIEAAIEEAVDFIIFAGDIFDGNWKDMGTGLHFAREMGRLKAEGIPAFLLKGNHDADSRLTKNVPWPDNVQVFDTKPTTFKLDDIAVAIHGQSFKSAATTENLAAGYPEAIPGYFNIGVLHTALGGYSAHANYAPCRLDELCAKDYGYWALGHVHAYEVLHADSPTVLFPGNLQGRSVKETGEKGAVLVTVTDGKPSYERLIFNIVRWHELSVDATDCATVAEVQTLIKSGLQEILDESPTAMNAVRIKLTGNTAANKALVTERAQLRTDILAIAVGLSEDGLWIEKVRDETSPPVNQALSEEQEGALAEFSALFQSIGGHADFAEKLKGDFERLLNASDKDAIEQSPELKALRDGDLQTLIDQAVPALSARLRGGAA